MAKSKNWVFTDNNPEADEPDWPENVKYAIWQKERGENATEHLQGYVELKTVRAMSYLKGILPRAHWEIRRGTQQQAMDYASKEDTRISGPWTFGELVINAQGTRSDLLALKASIAEDLTETQLWDKHWADMHKCYRGVMRYRCLTGLKRDWAPRIYLLIGEPGCGKTSFCRRVAPDAYWKQSMSKWWDGYDGQSDVILDDFYGWIPYHTMLRLCDRYAELVESKGGQCQFIARRIFITSNREPREWWDIERVRDIDALERRFREFAIRITDYTQDLLN
uniref:Replication-associated protein n=1 Tax=Barbastella barbastellus feces associated circovirus 1 TaxID=3139967 RepID=A0AAU6S517_9CIRC